MESKLATAARQRLIDDLRRMTPEQRLAAYVAHCKLVVQLQLAGASMRRAEAVSPARNAS